MKTFLTVMCFALVATAIAKPAYDYQQPPAPVAPAPQYAAPVQQQYAAPAPVQQQYSAPSNQYLAPVQQPQYTAPAAVPQYQPQQQTIVNKDIYIHSAADETEEIGNENGVESGPLRKNYRIVFIKAPAQNVKLNLDSLKRAQASNEEKTVIYVLSKKPDLGNLQSQLASVQNDQKPHKPEVHFIKYKTQDEANRAQQEIQAQYEQLGGSTSISDEGIAPVTSVIGGGRVNVGSVGPSFSGGNTGSNFGQSAGPAQQQFGQQSYQGSTSSSGNFGAAPSQNYLPSQ